MVEPSKTLHETGNAKFAGCAISHGERFALDVITYARCREVHLEVIIQLATPAAPLLVVAAVPIKRKRGKRKTKRRSATRKNVTSKLFVHLQRMCRQRLQ